MLSAEVGNIEEEEAVPEEEEHTAADGLPVLPNTLMGSGSPSPSSCSRDERACLEVGKVLFVNVCLERETSSGMRKATPSGSDCILVLLVGNRVRDYLSRIIGENNFVENL